MSDLQTGLTSLISAMPGYIEAAQFYNDEIEELFFSSTMRRQLARSGNADMSVNLARIAVDVVADRLEINAITVDDEHAQQVIDQLSIDNEFDLVLPGLFRSTLMYGDAYLILDGDAEEGVNLFENSPLTTRVLYSPENPRAKAFAIKRWSVSYEGATYVRVNLWYADRVERYITSAKDAKGTEAKEFEPFTDPNDETDTDSELVNEFGFIPVYHFRSNSRPYGTPEHKQCYGTQQAINKLAITHLATIDYLGFPQRYIMAAQGSDSSEIDEFDADLFHDDTTPDAPDQGPSDTTSAYKADPGGVWTMAAGSTAGQFDAADSENFIDSVGLYVRLMAQASGTPLHYFDPSGDTPSGESLRVADAPLVKKVRNRSLSFGSALQDALSDALVLYGIDASPMVHWASPESNDSLNVWEVAKAKIEAGVTPYQAMSEAGYLPGQLEAMGITPQTAPMTLSEKAAVLQQVGQAIQSLSAGVTAGIVTADQVNLIVEQFLSDAAPQVA